VRDVSAITSILGRADEVRACVDLLSRRQQRWISIVAPGGMGKTALARDIQAQALAVFEHGSDFVDLTTVHSAEQMVNTIARMISIPALGDDPLQTLCEGLQCKDTLLILDNAENVPGEAGREALARLLTHAPHLSILLTTRVPLGHPMESIRYLGGLSQQPDESGISPAEALFVREARKVFPGVRVEGPAADHVQAICTMTGGMPLAIELAAAWARLLTPEIIADQLRHSIDWLSTSYGFGYSPQRSIRAVLDYFWSRLTENERAQLSPLAVFRGGFDAELAHAVSGASEPFLQKLRQHAFLTQLQNGRYVLHELLRQYLDEKLTSEQAQQAHRRLAGEMRALAVRAEPALENADHTAMMKQLEHEHSNIEAALVWFKSQQDADAISDIANGIALFWEFAGHGPSMAHWHAWAIAHCAGDTPARLQRKFALQMHHASLMNEMDRLDAEREDTLAAQATLEHLPATIDTREERARVALALAHNCRATGDLIGLAEHSEIGLHLARAVSDTFTVTWGLGLRASALHEVGDYARATRLHDERLAILRAHRIPTRLCIGLVAATYTCIQIGDLAGAAQLSAEANSIAAEIKDIHASIDAAEVAAELSEACDDLVGAERQLIACIAMDRVRAPVQSARARIALARVRLRIGGDVVTPLRDGLSYALSHTQRAPQIDGLLVAAHLRMREGDTAGALELAHACLASPYATAALKSRAGALETELSQQLPNRPCPASLPIERCVAGVLGTLNRTPSAFERDAVAA
jgi:predicted ATPase